MDDRGLRKLMIWTSVLGWLTALLLALTGVIFLISGRYWLGGIYLALAGTYLWMVQPWRDLGP